MIHYIMVQVLVMTHLVGLTYQQITTKKNLLVSKKRQKKIHSDSDVLIVIGIGGSYLGARAAIETLNHSFYNVLEKGARKTPQVFFAEIASVLPTYMTLLK